MRLSVIIPALNEAANINGALASAMSAPDVEVIVADGGSIDGTPEMAETAGARVITSAPGRARQMNKGAAAATGDTLLFLHADTHLPDGYQSRIEETLSRPGVIAGAFRLKIGSPRRCLRLIERLANFRSERMGLPYGDQGIFLRKSVFDEAGGFPEQPIMEDYELMRRLKRRGRVALANAAAVTSARRWERLGVIKTTLINQLVIIGYLLGVKPERLKALYSGERRNKTPCL
jgi:rSAM/selenodomain-associated transferase 2